MRCATALIAFASHLFAPSSATTQRRHRRLQVPPTAVETFENRLLLTFGVNGIALTDVSGGQGDWIEEIALQPDGKIVAAGNVGVARFNVDGSLDTTFNSGGPLPGVVRMASAYFNGVAVQADGKIVIVGRTYVPNEGDFLVCRFNADGTPDAAFGTNGVVTTNLTKGKRDEGIDVAIQSDGKIVVVGYAGDSWANAPRWTVVRYTSSGALDKSFNKSGIITGFGKGADRETATAVLLQAAGKIVVAGHANDATGKADFVVARYNADGTLDRTFGGTGKVQTDLGSEQGATSTHEEAKDIAIDQSGRLVVAGGTSGGRVALIRLLPNGALDAAFAGDGKLAIDSQLSANAFEGVSVQADGKIVAVGGNWAFVAARFNDDGSLDTTFSTGTDGADGRDGWLWLQAGGEGSGDDVLIQPDGKILMAGSGTADLGTDFALVRLNSDGSLDAPVVTATSESAASDGEEPAVLFAGANTSEDDALAAQLLYDLEEDLLSSTS